jgi:Fibronectin type III domain
MGFHSRSGHAPLRRASPRLDGVMARGAVALLAAIALASGAQTASALPVSAQFVQKAGDPRGGDAGYNTFKRLPDGRGVAHAGFSHDRRANNAVVVYDPVSDHWQVAVPHTPWVDTTDVTGRPFLGNRDNQVTLVVDGKYWALDGQRGIDLVGNWRGVLDPQTWQWQIEDNAALFAPTGSGLGPWYNSAAGWIPGLDIGYVFGGYYSGGPTDGLIRITRNPPGATPPFTLTTFRNPWGNPSFPGSQRLLYVSNQHWVRGNKLHVYDGRREDPNTGARAASATLYEIDVAAPTMQAISVNTVPLTQRVEGGAVLGYYDAVRDIAVVTDGVFVNVYDYATSTWANVPVLTPEDPLRESPSSQGAGRAGFYAPEIDEFIILGGQGRVYGLQLDHGAPTVPGAPLAVVAIPGDASATVTFAPPASDGGSAITGYTVVSNPPGGLDAEAGTLSMSRSITGLTNGIAYTFTVSATNAIGTGPPSQPSNAVTPMRSPTVPGPAQSVIAAPGNANATVAFSAPTDDGGSPITGYAVQSNPPGGVDTQAGSTATTHLITGLVNGTSYTFTVKATNSVGTGPPSSPSNVVTPATIPDPPVNVVAVGGNTSATVSFAAPASNGGSPIIGYTVISSPPGGLDAEAGTLSMSRSITGLTNGIAYTFTVVATNAVGNSAASAASNPVVPAAAITVPGAPTAVVASAGAASATVTFAAPSNTGGSPITGYAVQSNPPGGVDASAGTLTIPRTITGLVNGTPYTFTVVATNIAGTGPASAPSNVVTPADVPGPPTNVVATPGNGSASVTFAPPSVTGGKPISGYTVTSIPSGGVDANAGSTATTHAITGLTNGVSYQFVVVARNAVGSGTPSLPSNAVTPKKGLRRFH